MPARQLHTSAFVLGRQSGGADNFEQLALFSGEHGLLSALQRITKKAASMPADLLDEAEFSLESRNEGRTWFVREHRLIHRPTAIGASYAALRCASAIAQLVRQNPIAGETRPAVAGLLRQSLAALASGHRPDLVWLKSLYCFARDEGLPVKQQWWRQLGEADRGAAQEILTKPLASQSPSAAAIARLVQRLEHWIAAETEIRLATR